MIRFFYAVLISGLTIPCIAAIYFISEVVLHIQPYKGFAFVVLTSPIYGAVFGATYGKEIEERIGLLRWFGNCKKNLPGTERRLVFIAITWLVIWPLLALTIDPYNFIDDEEWGRFWLVWLAPALLLLLLRFLYKRIVL